MQVQDKFEFNLEFFNDFLFFCSYSFNAKCYSFNESIHIQLRSSVFTDSAILLPSIVGY